jgi:hypothetical protein
MRQRRQPPYVDRLGEALHCIAAARFEMGVSRQGALHRLGDEDLASRREIGQARREVYGFADRGITAA